MKRKPDRKLKLLLAIAAFLLILFVAWRVAFWSLVFIFAASVAEIYNTHFRTPFHFDLTKLGTILAAVAYGAGVGIFVGISATVFSKIFASRLDFTALPSIAAITLIAVLAAVFSGSSITLLGISLVALYYAITSPINLYMGEDPPYAIAYVLSSLAVNVVLFTQVAPRIIGLL